MMQRVQELCRRLEPILGPRTQALWTAYLAAGDADDRADVEQTLELLAARHLGLNYQPDRAPFPPPPRGFAEAGDVACGRVLYAGRELFPFLLPSARLKEHVLIGGRSGSGKTNLTFVLMHAAMARGIHVLAIDWKRAYRDLLELQPDLRIYTVGRDVAPFRLNPLIPPAGCEPATWIKLIVDVIASSYLGGEGVISLLVSGLHQLYEQAGAFSGTPSRWPTFAELLVWIRAAKLRGRAAMWQASAERILIALSYGEFGDVLNTQNNRDVSQLLACNVVLEMDGLSGASDRAMFTEALTLYLYRDRLVAGPQEQLTNLIVLEEAHHILSRRPAEARESVLESSIRMIRQYGIGYVFIDQSASLLSKVAFANSYATFALSQKLRADIQTMAGAMNLSDEQRDALSTLPVGTAVVRLADQHPEPFLIRLPRSPVRDGYATDSIVRQHMAGYSAKSGLIAASELSREPITAVPPPDENQPDDLSGQIRIPHPPSPKKQLCSDSPVVPVSREAGSEPAPPPDEHLTREELRFLTDLVRDPLGTTVVRYQRLHLSRRRGNAVRQSLTRRGLIEPVPIATRSGQVVLCTLTDAGLVQCEQLGLQPHRPRASLEHTYWARRAAEHFERQGYSVALEQPVPGDGFVDVVAERGGTRLAIEIETGKSDIRANICKLASAGFDRIVLLATSPAAIEACQRALAKFADGVREGVEIASWLDIS